MKANRLISAALCGMILISVSGAAVQTAAAVTENNNITVASDESYDTYIAEIGDVPRPQSAIVIGKEQLDAALSSSFEMEGNGIKTEESATVVFRFHVEQTGLYNMKIRYTTVTGKGTAIQRGMQLDGKIPYSQAGSVTLNRVYRDNTSGAKVDSRGNEYTPEQDEVFGSYEQIIYDGQGYIDTPLPFYLTAGEHTLTFISQKEPVILEQIHFFNQENVISYSELKKSYETAGYRAASEEASVTIEAEDADLKSSRTLYPDNDRTSSLTQPSDVSRVVMNTVGGSNWRYPGQWITWKIKVGESGLYKLCFRFKQNYTEGQNSVRALYIDDKLPFAEARNISFGFSYDWQMKMPGGEEPYLFYFEAGREYTLKLENTLGVYASILRETQNCVLSLNEVYRQVKMVVGASADNNQRLCNR